jgi:hypothetical protein
MVDMSIGGFGNAALVRAGNRGAWLSQYQPTIWTFAQLKCAFGTP